LIINNASRIVYHNDKILIKITDGKFTNIQIFSVDLTSPIYISIDAKSVYFDSKNIVYIKDKNVYFYNYSNEKFNHINTLIFGTIYLSVCNTNKAGRFALSSFSHLYIIDENKICYLKVKHYSQ
jgi:hypothetical protein